LGLIQNQGLFEVLQGVFDVAGEYLQVRGPFEIEVARIHEMPHERGFAALARPQQNYCRELPGEGFQCGFGGSRYHRPLRSTKRCPLACMHGREK
jgi:hypothetical protein